MQDIAAAVGLYKGSLYHYIGGKEELLARVFERAGCAAGRRRADRRRDAPAAERHCGISSSVYVEAVAENLDALTVYLHEWRALAGDSQRACARSASATRWSRRSSARDARRRFCAPDASIATLG